LAELFSQLETLIVEFLMLPLHLFPETLARLPCLIANFPNLRPDGIHKLVTLHHEQRLSRGMRHGRAKPTEE
jgi:hypothetical protein